jgi:hypothetical protein
MKIGLSLDQRMGWSSESLAVLEHCTSSLNIFSIFYFICCCLSHLYTLFLCSAWLGYCRTESFNQLQSTQNILSNVLVTYSYSFLKIFCGCFGPRVEPIVPNLNFSTISFVFFMLAVHFLYFGDVGRSSKITMFSFIILCGFQ